MQTEFGGNPEECFSSASSTLWVTRYYHDPQLKKNSLLKREFMLNNESLTALPRIP